MNTQRHLLRLPASELALCPIKKKLPAFDEPWLRHAAKGCVKELCLMFDTRTRKCRGVWNERGESNSLK